MRSRAAATLPSPDALARLTLCFALLTGLLEVGILTIERMGLGVFSFAGTYALWMAPLGYVVLFAVPGAALVLLSAWRPELVTAQRGLFVLGFVTCVSLLTLSAGLAPYTIILLALGLSFQGARLLARRGGIVALAERSSTWLFGAVLALIPTQLGAMALEERRGVKQLPEARAGAPNVLLIFLDTVRAANLSAYGYARPTTPFLERVAQRGVRFDLAIAPAPWTLPTHASVLTGWLPSFLSTDWLVPLDEGPRTITEELASHGYRTGGFVANLMYTTHESGLARGFHRFRDFQLTAEQVLLSTSLWQELRVMRKMTLTGSRAAARSTWRYADRKPAPAVTDEFLDWVGNDSTRPFFAFLNYFDAHSPFRPPPALAARFRSHPAGGPRTRHERARDRYDACIAYLDSELERLFDSLDARGILDHTIVIVTADHGEQFGEHDLDKHGNSLYMQLLRVPLLIFHPRAVPEGQVIQHAVSLRDVPATVLDLAGLPDRFPGSTLRRFWDPALATGAARPVVAVSSGRRAPRASAAEPIVAHVTGGLHHPLSQRISHGPVISVLADPWHYIRWGDGGEELYDVREDPEEVNDLARTPEGRARLPLLKAMLDSTLSAESRSLGRIE